VVSLEPLIDFGFGDYNASAMFWKNHITKAIVTIDGGHGDLSDAGFLRRGGHFGVFLLGF
jgi:hypothetical protein